MSAAGVVMVAAGAGAGLLVAFVLRTRLPAPIVAALLAVCGVVLTWGAILLQPAPSPAEVAAGVAAMAVFVPVHVRIVVGRFGPGARR